MSETLFPLFKRNVREVTYEHVLVQTLPKDIIIGAAERNLYIDPPTKILSKEKTRILIDGTIMISEMDGSGRIISRKTKHLDSGLIETCYKNLADFLSLGRLREQLMFSEPRNTRPVAKRRGTPEFSN